MCDNYYCPCFVAGAAEMDALPGINGPPRVRQRVDSVIAQHLSNGPFFSCARLQPTVMEASVDTLVAASCQIASRQTA